MEFIIYEDDKEFINCYKKVILQLMGSSSINYKIIEIDHFDDGQRKILSKIQGNKIYILDVEVPGKTGIDLAREIRKTGDWISPIIVVTSHEEFQSVGYTAKILMLDFISKKEGMKQKLYEALTIALEMISPDKNLCFLTKGEMFQIPHQDILYIEKNLNDNASSIHTKDTVYSVRKTIQTLEAELVDGPFVKTHRSFLVNLKNIRHVDFDKGIITFNNNKTALLSRSNKKKLKEIMGVTL